MAPLKTTCFRLDDGTIERLDRVAEALTKRASGAPVVRASAARLALERGLGELERELAVTKAARKKK